LDPQVLFLLTVLLEVMLVLLVLVVMLVVEVVLVVEELFSFMREHTPTTDLLYVLVVPMHMEDHHLVHHLEVVQLLNVLVLVVQEQLLLFRLIHRQVNIKV
jgi:hypothetical protein